MSNLQRIKYKLFKLIARARLRYGIKLFKRGKLLISIGVALTIIPYAMAATLLLYLGGAVLVLISRASRKEKIKWIVYSFLVIVGMYLLIFLLIMLFIFLYTGGFS